MEKRDIASILASLASACNKCEETNCSIKQFHVAPVFDYLTCDTMMDAAADIAALAAARVKEIVEENF